MVDYVEIEAADWRFQMRVAAVCVWRDHVLLLRALAGDFWVLPGGRVQPLEPTAEALRRTMSWEIGEGVTVGRLLWVMEYVFPWGGQLVHELGFYYAIDLPEGSPFLDLKRDHKGVERGQELLLRWFPTERLAGLRLSPDFLRAALQELPDTPHHIVSLDIGPGSDR